MPIFFYIDPEFADDPFMNDVKDICLSYVFFRAKNQEDEQESTPAPAVTATKTPSVATSSS
jgi:cytochrome c oxidase assembly protein Cox11